MARKKQTEDALDEAVVPEVAESKPEVAPEPPKRLKVLERFCVLVNGTYIVINAGEVTEDPSRVYLLLQHGAKVEAA